MPRGRTEKGFSMEKKRFSKALAIEVLGKLAGRIETELRFNCADGTAQLAQIEPSERERVMVARAVEYGRMRAFRQFAEAIEDVFA